MPTYGTGISQSYAQTQKLQMSSSPLSQDFTIFTKSSVKKRGILRISRILLRFDLYSCLHDQHDKDSSVITCAIGLSLFCMAFSNGFGFSFKIILALKIISSKNKILVEE
jgi:hypothetical protein